MNDVVAILEKIEALEAQVRALSAPPPPQGWGWIAHFANWLVANAAGIATLLGAIAAVLFIYLLLRFLHSGGGRIKEAKLHLAGSELSIEAAAEKLNQMLQDVQDQVVRTTAERRRQHELQTARILSAIGQPQSFSGTPAMPPGAFADLPPEPPDRPPLNILWVTDDDDILDFERAVLDRMGHDVKVVGSNDALIGALRKRTDWDLVLSDWNRNDNDSAVRTLFRTLQEGVLTAGHLKAGRTYTLGPDLRFAVYTWPNQQWEVRETLGKLSQAQDRAHWVVATDFAHLQDRINWLQEAKAARH